MGQNKDNNEAVVKKVQYHWCGPLCSHHLVLRIFLLLIHSHCAVAECRKPSLNAGFICREREAQRQVMTRVILQREKSRVIFIIQLNLHLWTFSISAGSCSILVSPSSSRAALWYRYVMSSVCWNISSRAADCTCNQTGHSLSETPLGKGLNEKFRINHLKTSLRNCFSALI